MIQTSFLTTTIYNDKNMTRSSCSTISYMCQYFHMQEGTPVTKDNNNNNNKNNNNNNITNNIGL